MDSREQVEKSIVKKYRRTIWLKFVGAVKEYGLIREGDRIAVCLSGGKDSMLMAKCMQQLHRYSDFPFGVEYLTMDPGYSPANRRLIEENAQTLGVPVHIFKTEIFDTVAKMEDSPCYVCARMRRGYLYKHARQLGCNKIALGHHFDDVTETVLMSMLYGSEIRTMMPKLHSAHYPGMELIRPMYLVRESDILAWKRYNGLMFLNCACRFTERCAVQAPEESVSKRQEMKLLIRQLRQVNPNVDQNIFTSVANVNLDAIVGYRKGGVRHSFLENYDG